METPSKFSLYVGLLIPIVIIAVVAGIVFVPRMKNKPQVDFVYSVLPNLNYTGGYDNVNECYWPITNYKVINGTLTKVEDALFGNMSESKAKSCLNIAKSLLKPSTINGPINYDIYRYSVTEEKATKITFDQAKALSLDPAVESSDGYRIGTGGNRGGFILNDLFGGRNYYSRYLYGHNTSYPIKIDIDTTRANYYDGLYSFTFIGWVK